MSVALSPDFDYLYASLCVGFATPALTFVASISKSRLLLAEDDFSNKRHVVSRSRPTSLPTRLFFSESSAKTLPCIMSVESNAVEKMRKALSDFSPVWEDVIALTSAHGDAVIGVRAGEDEETALHTAAYWGEIDAINVLLGAGSDVSARNRTGATPLHLCALNSRSEVRFPCILSSILQSSVSV